MINRELSKIFSLYAELLLLHEKDEGLSKLLSGASYRIRRMGEEITEISKDNLTRLFRPQIIKLVNEIKNTGTIAAVDELIQLTPTGLFEMMRIRGLGGKKIALLWKIAKIDTLDALLQACKEDKLRKVPGFGLKTQANIVKSIEAYSSHKDRFHYASVAEVAAILESSLQQIFNTKLVSLCGEIRRQTTTVSGIEIITTLTAKKINSKVIGRLMIIKSSTKEKTIGHTLDEIPVTIFHTSPQKYFTDLFIRTGSDAHVKKIMGTKKNIFKSEDAIYKMVKLPFITPELREDLAEWDFAKKSKELITAEDIKGVVHNHTTWSDGVDRLPDFINACRQKKFEYAVISDHSKNAHYAGGMKEEKILRQFKEIDKLNKEVSPFRIFKSIECDILVSGELDYETSFLKKFDLVIVSIHQLLKMDEAKATRRLLKAIEHPCTTILGHMTGRQLLIRPGYPVNIKKIIDACAANNVVIEINANPYRLDMDWTHIPYAMKKKVMISINPDAHSIAEIDNIKWGVAAARKGGLTKELTWNAMPLDKILNWLKN